MPPIRSTNLVAYKEVAASWALNNPGVAIGGLSVAARVSSAQARPGAARRIWGLQSLRRGDSQLVWGFPAAASLDGSIGGRGLHRRPPKPPAEVRYDRTQK